MTMLKKSLGLSQVELKFDGQTRKFSGYASVFDGVDSYGDTILRGAFSNTLKNNPAPKMFFGHQQGLPIGKWTSLVEDEKGLRVEGELTEGNPQSDAILAALRHGTVDGLSIGFLMSSQDYEDKKDGGRTIKNISRLLEISIVNFPADSSARIEVRSEDIDEIKSIRDLENFLRDSGGFSRSVATSIVAKAKKLFLFQRESDEEAETLKQLAERINCLAQKAGEISNSNNLL